MAVQRRGLGKGLDSMIPNKKKVISQESDRQQSEEKNQNADSQNVSRETSTDETDSLHQESAEIRTAGKSEPESDTADELSEKQIVHVRISKIEPNKSQPRKQFNEDALQELADSISRYGVIQPLLVYNRQSYYEIIAGERRWRAAKLAGLKEVPVIIKNYSEREKVEVSLIENIQRENLNPIEEAKAYRRLTEEFGLKQDELAESVSKSRTAITNSMRLLKLTDEVQKMVESEMISSGHARALLAIENPETQKSAAIKVFDEKLSVRDTERLVKKLMSQSVKPVERFRDTSQDAVYESIEERLKMIIGTKVAIQRKKDNKGKIEIEYYSHDDFERIIDLLNSINER